MKVLNRSLKVGGEKRVINDVTIQALQFDKDGKVLLCTGSTVPTDASSGFAKGAIFIDTDASGKNVMYVNEGSTTSSDFNALPSGGVVSLTPDDSEGAGVNVIPAGISKVIVGANVNGVNDFLVLPALADVSDGFEITVVSNSAGHEVRTPADSDEEVNSENCDGTKEYAIASGGQIHKFVKISDTIGWMGHGYTAIGAVVTAVVPD